MRKKALIITFMVIISMFTSVAYAARTTSGKSSGGSDGKANLKGEIWIVRNSTNPLGKDEVAAKTVTDAAGTIAVRTVIWFNDGSQEKTNVREAWNYGTQLSVQAAIQADNHYANKGTAGHIFSSKTRGEWAGSTDIKF